MERYTISHRQAELIGTWLKERGGVAVWGSCNLSSRPADMLTPALDKSGVRTSSPRSDCVLDRTITDPDDLEVAIDHEVKRFHVAVRMGSQGMSLKVTDGGTRRIRKEVAKAGKGAYYIFAYDDWDNAVIMAPEKVVPFIQYVEDLCGKKESKET
jgi:hypothetical protein